MWTNTALCVLCNESENQMQSGHVIVHKITPMFLMRNTNKWYAMQVRELVMVLRVCVSLIENLKLQLEKYFVTWFGCGGDVNACRCCSIRSSNRLQTKIVNNFSLFARMRVDVIQLHSIFGGFKLMSPNSMCQHGILLLVQWMREMEEKKMNNIFFFFTFHLWLRLITEKLVLTLIFNHFRNGSGGTKLCNE